MKAFRRSLFVGIVLACLVGAANSQDHPVHYKITVKAEDLSGFDVEMRILRLAPGAIRVAMAAHPEYDDRYWRYIENFSATDARGRKLLTVKDEDAIWRIEGVAGDVYVRYRLDLPKNENSWRDAWKPFLTPYGGMVGDLHSLMFVSGQSLRQARLTIEMPDGWTAASGLKPTMDPRVFTGSTELMLDSPVLIGNLMKREFRTAGVPHTVVFWTEPGRPKFDPDAIAAGLEKLTKEAVRAFGRPPYPRYVFLLQNGGSAALEHFTSVNLGITTDLADFYSEAAHEYVHVWNLMDVRPRERIGLRYRFAEPTGVLWWNEGATIMFADLLIRRAGLPGENRTRVKRLESMIARYLSAPGYYTLSAEQVSRGDSHPDLLGNNYASTHLQGELLTTMLDLYIRDSTNGRKDTSDVMRLLSTRFDNARGIANSDIQNAIAEVCRCDVKDFFKEYIYGATKVDLEKYLRLIGLQAVVGRTPAVDREGRPAVDLRIGPSSAEDAFRIRITNPQSTWARAGLRTGDIVKSVNRTPVSSWPDLRSWLVKLKIGDTGTVVIVRDGATRTVEVPISGYDISTVEINELPNATAKQLRLRNAWMNAN